MMGRGFCLYYCAWGGGGGGGGGGGVGRGRAVVCARCPGNMSVHVTILGVILVVCSTESYKMFS